MTLLEIRQQWDRSVPAVDVRQEKGFHGLLVLCVCNFLRFERFECVYIFILESQ